MTSLPANPVLAAPASAAVTTRVQAAQQVAARQQTQPAAAVTAPASTVLEISSTTPKPRPAVYTVAATLSPAWVAQPKDNISARMASNSAMGSLGGQWSQLGGMLLSHLSSNNTGYSQTLLTRPDATRDLDMQMRGVRSGAATVSLDITTRSGQKVQLHIAANGSQGMHVEIHSSGPLSTTERQALATLSEGLDRALAGLGKEGAPAINLSGLMDYDRKALASLSLNVNAPQGSNTSLQSLRLHLNDRTQTLDLATTTGGQVSVRLNPSTALASAESPHKQAALSQHLQHIQTAADRSHADAELVALFTSSLMQMHGMPASASTSTPMPPALGAQVAPLLSGLADFEASFSGSAQRTNSKGAITEQSQTTFHTSQRTESRYHADTGNLQMAQTVQTRLDATIHQAPHPDGMLDMDSGNYTTQTIHDLHTQQTLIAAQNNLLTQAEQRQDTQQSLTVQKFIEHTLTEQYERPHHAQQVKQLLQALQ